MQHRARRIARAAIACAVAGWAQAAMALMPLSPTAEKHAPRVGVNARAALTVPGMGAAAARTLLHLDTATSATTTLKVLVILAEFSDVAATTSATTYDSLLFSASRPAGSMRQYYRENSYGALDVTGKVEGPWIHLSHPRDYYANGSGGLFGTYPRNAQYLVEEAVLGAANYVDFAQYDGNGDGYVDYLIVVHSGRGKEQTNGALDIHSHTWTTFHDVTVDGVRVSTYSTVPEDGQIGVCTHEFGHQLGLPDLYTASGAGIGLFSLMATGAWGGRVVEGDHPTQLDAWCKARLGFLRPTVVSRNATAQALPPVEMSPTAWKLWTLGAPAHEYFLAENRQYVGQDDVHPTTQLRGLPNAGFVLYHIDDAVPGNLQPAGQDTFPHLQVALVEADGDTLGKGTINSVAGDWGTASDVFGVAPRNITTWERGTVPSSRDYGRRDTQVALRGMHLSGTTAIADVEVANAPALRGDGLAVSGVSDGLLYAGRQVAVAPRVRNRGLAATSVSAALSVADPFASIAGSAVTVGAVPADTTIAAVAGNVQLALGSALPADPYVVPVIFDLTGTGGAPPAAFSSRDTVWVASGSCFSFADDAESSLPRFRDTGTATGVHARWRRSADRNMTPGGSYAWRCGSDIPSGAYDARLDMTLESQPFQLDGTGALSFWSYMDAESGPPGVTYDGGLVEIAVGDGPWNPLELDGGYPYSLRAPQGGIAAELLGRGALGGHDSAAHRFTASLAGLTGVARLRFRFVSDASVGYDGWTIDDVLVDTDTQPYAVLPHDPSTDAGGTALAWRVVEGRSAYAGSGFALYASPSEVSAVAGTLQRTLATLTRVGTIATSADLRSALLPALEGGGYVLADSAAGRPARLYTFSSSQAAVRFSVSPILLQIGRGVATIRFQVGSSSGGSVPVRVDVVDVQGRRIATLADGPRYPGPQVLSWDGRKGVATDTRGPAGDKVASGVYFIAIQAGGKRYMAKLPVVR